MLPPNLFNLLLEKFNIQNADPKKQQEFITSFEDLIQQSLTNFFIDNLNDDDFETFSRMQEEDQTGAQAINFANGKIPELEKKLSALIEEEINKLQN